ncbi:MAG: beta-galactosidase [Verrucomicrobiae bacterium]|nr:beta-galactosidase [Verrucomicrobiae bacterium]
MSSLVRARGVEESAPQIVRNDQVSRRFEARVVYRDALLFDGLERLSRENLLPQLTELASEGSWLSPQSVAPFSSLPSDGALTGQEHSSLALREWTRGRNAQAAAPSQDGASLSVVQGGGGSGGQTSPPSLTLADFTQSNEADRFVRTNVTLAPVRNELGAALRLSASNTAADSILTLDNPAGWNLSGNGEVVFSLKNNGPQVVTNTWILVDAEGRRISIQSFLAPGSYRNFHIPLVPATYTKSYTDEVLKSLRGATYLNTLAMNLARIVRFQVTGRLGSSTIEIGNLVAGGIPLPAQNPFPLVDEFGQYRYYGWDGKMTNYSELVERRGRERLELKASPKPAGWNEYGGWADGPLRTATGHFRTEKYNGKWYLVDPSGRLFFSIGVNEVHDRHDTAITQRTHFFPPLPTVAPDPGGIYGWVDSTLSTSYFAGAGVQSFSFFRHNLLQKYGSDWRNQFFALAPQRLRSWGFNVMVNNGNFSYYQDRRIPYVLRADTSFPVTIPGSVVTWGHFPDVYDFRFSDNLSSKLDAWSTFAFSKEDPWCIGFFVDNELPWADTSYRENELGQGALSAPATQPAKIAFIRQLQGKYPNIASLNKAWATAFTSWEQILVTSVKLTTTQVANARTDLSLFFAQTADTYFSKVRAVMQAKAPRKLYLGSRFSRLSSLALRSASRYCDIISLNHYGRSPLQILNRRLPDNYTFRECVGDKPLLMSEFSFSGLDGGLIDNYGIAGLDEEDRAQLYKQFVYDALVEPSLVGTHYYRFVSEMVTGRSFDGEAKITGLIDHTDRPYRHFVAATRQLSDAMYAIRSGAAGLPPLLPSKPDILPQSAIPRQIVAISPGDGQVELTIHSPPATAARYEWSIVSSPAGSNPGVLTGTTQTAMALHSASGTYQYQVRFRDASGALIDAPVLSSSVDVRINADLVPVSVAPLSAKPGEVVNFSAVLKNAGSASSLLQSTAVSFDLVPKAGGYRIPLGYGVKVTSMDAGATLSLSATDGGPLNNGKWVAVKGQYLLRAVVDDQNRIPESNNANNALTVDFEVTDSVAAAQSTQLKIAVTPRADGLVTLSVQNPPSGTVKYEWSVVSAPAGAKTVSFATASQTTTAVHFASGQYQYGVLFRNALGVVIGSRLLSDPATLNITADLKPVSVSPVQAKTGDLVTFTAVLQNIGSSASLQGKTAATFELVPKAGGAAIAAGYGVATTALGAGASLSVPATDGGPLNNGKWVAVKGQYVLRVIADDVDRIPESSNANNVLSVDFTVTD